MKPRSISNSLAGLLAFVFFVTTPASAQTEAEVKAQYTKLEQLIPMRDGIKLFTSIYMPKDKSKKCYPGTRHRSGTLL